MHAMGSGVPQDTIIISDDDEESPAPPQPSPQPMPEPPIFRAASLTYTDDDIWNEHVALFKWRHSQIRRSSGFSDSDSGDDELIQNRRLHKQNSQRLKHAWLSTRLGAALFREFKEDRRANMRRDIEKARAFILPAIRDEHPSMKELALAHKDEVEELKRTYTEDYFDQWFGLNDSDDDSDEDKFGSDM